MAKLFNLLRRDNAESWEVQKNELEGKYKVNRKDFNYTERDLSPILRNNPVIEEYINNVVKKVNEVLKNE